MSAPSSWIVAETYGHSTACPVNGMMTLAASGVSGIWFEALEIEDRALRIVGPSRLHAHPGRHLRLVAGVDRVQHRRVGTVDRDQREGERCLQRVLGTRRGDPRPRR